MTISRREAIVGAASLLGGMALGKPVRSAIGAKGTNGGAAAGWVNPYVSDGLIAMWDGEWNAGGGVHDPNATTWVDLSGNNHDASLTAKGSWDDFALSCAGSGPAASAAMFGWSFVEMVLSSSYNGTADNLLLFASNSTTGKIVRFGNGGIGQTYGLAAPITSLQNPTYYATALGSVSTSYINGMEVANTLSTKAWSGRSRIFVGGRDDSSNSNPCKFFAIRFYSRVLSAAEVAANYAVDKQRFGL